LAADPNNDAIKAEELTEMVRQIRERVRARYPSGPAETGRIPGADLMPLVHARDAAEAKVAAIGSVNPRPGGLLNALIQTVKRTISRGLDWFVRDQVVFNREVMACLEAATEALNELNRALAAAAPVQAINDLRAHWTAWSSEWERKVATNELQFARSVADLQGAFQYRLIQLENNYRDMVKSQHSDYLSALDRANLDIQKRLWADLERIRTEYEALIHSELRIVRQRASYLAPPASVHTPPPATGVPNFDYGRFAERFRGPEEYVKNGQRFYVSYFAGCKDVLDIGCGRGEFLELMRDAGVPARGIDLGRESVDFCRSKGLQAEVADLFAYLESLADASLDGIFSAQVVEHLPPERLPEMIRLAAQKLARGGVIALETPNPECLAIFATHFYLDPTHTRPIPPALLAFYMEENALGRIETHFLSPAAESMPSLAALPAGFRTAFFGGLDYAMIARKLT
jgi:O-antigen chain-terminating methyltransferase